MPETLCGFNSTPEASGSELLMVHGPTLAVDIGFDPDWRAGDQTVPQPIETNVRALVDTGADECCIDEALAQRLGLPLINKINMGGVDGVHEANVYLAQVHCPSLDFTIHGNFSGVRLSDLGGVHEALIGRTFLRHMKMIYEGQTGTVKISRD